MKTVHVREISNIKMVSGNEKKYSKVIHNGVVKVWVGIGWIAEDTQATKEDHEKYPVVVY